MEANADILAELPRLLNDEPEFVELDEEVLLGEELLLIEKKDPLLLLLIEDLLLEEELLVSICLSNNKINNKQNKYFGFIL